MAIDGPLVDGAIVGGDAQPELRVCRDAVADGAAVAVREGLPIRGGDDAQVRVLGEQPGGEVAGDADALALLRGHADDEPAVGGAGGFDQGGIDEVECGRLDRLRVQLLRKSARCGPLVAAGLERAGGVLDPTDVSTRCQDAHEPS